MQSSRALSNEVTITHGPGGPGTSITLYVPFSTAPIPALSPQFTFSQFFLKSVSPLCQQIGTCNLVRK